MKRKIFSIISAFFILVLLLFLVFELVSHLGKKELVSNNDKIPSLPQIEQETEQNETIEPENNYSVKYKGKKYKFNENIINVLFIGVDTDYKKDETINGVSGHADVLLIGSINPDTNEVKIISIPRDTICDVSVYDFNGEPIGTQKLPISLSHAYGNGEKMSAELTATAVSELLYGLPIHAWYSLNVNSIYVINDAVGGVPIIADESNIKYLPRKTKIGEEVLLNGTYVKKYLINRYNEGDSSRRKRQRQYIANFVKRAKKTFLENPLIVADVYKKISDYSLTSLTLNEVVWLASEVVEMNIDTDFISLKGEEIQGDTMTEFHLDEVSLYEIMLDIFYTQVE